MLNPAAAVDRRTHPYNWALVWDIISRDSLRRLLGTIPDLHMLRRSTRSAGGDKVYAMWVLPLLERGVPSPELGRLDPCWRELVDCLNGPDYRQWVDRAVGVRVAAASADIGLFVFGPGDRVSAHTDKKAKLSTHVIYLNDTWDASHGGAFEVRAASGAGDDPPVASVIPAGGRSVLFEVSDSSWHAVAPVSPEAPVHRYTIQVEMWR